MKNRIDFTDSVLAARNGEVQAFEFLYNQSVQFFKAKLIPYSRNEQDAEDLLQECYIKIFSSLDQLKEPKAFLGWGAQICVRKGIDAVRARNKKEEHLKEEVHPMASEEDVQGMDAMSAAQYREQADPQEKLDAEETRRLLNEMIGDLPEMQKVCILLWQDNYSTAEIAETLDIPAGTVKSNITYAKKKIREKVLLLEKQGTRLYSLAPLPFFLWVMRLYTQEYLAAKPALASAASFRNILGNLPDGLIHAASNAAANAIPQAAQPLSSGAAQVQTGTFVQTASQTPSGLSGASTGTAGSGSGATSAATGGKMGHAAASSAAKAVGGAATKTVVTKVIISIVCVVIIGFGIFGTYLGITSFKELRRMDQENSTALSSSEDLEAGDIVEELSNLKYIGNTWYIGEEEKEVPAGYIMAGYADLDGDGEEEVYSFETNTDSEKSTLSLTVYDIIDNKWAMADSLILNEDNLNGQLRATQWTQYNGLIDNDTFYIIQGSGELYNNVIQYENNKLLQETTEKALIPIEAKYLMTYINWHTNTQESPYGFGAYKAQYAGSAEIKFEECYALNFVDYTDTSTYSFDNFEISLPEFYEDFITFKTDESNDQLYYYAIPNVEEMAIYHHSQMPFTIWEIIYTNWDTNSFEYYQNSNFRTQDTVTLLRKDENGFSYLLNYAGDASAGYADQTAFYDRYDLCVAYNMILYTLDYVEYNFTYTGDDPGTTYPIVESNTNLIQ